MAFAELIRRYRDRRMADVRKDEWIAVGWAYGWFFCLLMAYYVLRPLRESMGAGVGSRGLSRLFLVVLGVMLIANPLYSQLVSLVPRRRLVTIVYRFFQSHLLFFFCAIQFSWLPKSYVAHAYFVWVTVFGLFAVSVFWSFVTDAFSREQGKRLFGLIMSGGTVGALCGSLAAGKVAVLFGVAYLTLLATLLLELGMVFTRRLDTSLANLSTPPMVPETPLPSGPASPQAFLQKDDEDVSLWAGFTHVARSPYLLGICGFMFLQALCATTLYMGQADVIKSFYPDDDLRTEYFSRVNLAVQVLTFLLQSVVASLLMRRIGLALTLCIVPLLYFLGLIGVSQWPQLALFATIAVLGQATIYGLGNPVREVLYTVVTREDKYKAKNFIDTVVVRTGDAVTAQLFETAKPIGLSFVFVSAAAFAGAWVSISLWLGTRAERRHATERFVDVNEAR
ncbi:MAG: MFS transporter [Pirellulaceae bacterium]|nr:hypothetical protein [Planctomycetales bacterium]